MENCYGQISNNAKTNLNSNVVELAEYLKFYIALENLGGNIHLVF